MRRMNAAAMALVAGLLVSVTPALAHHSATAAYDESKQVEAKGTVTRVLLRNPHSWVFLESTDEQGQKIEWQIEMAASSSLGWTTDTLPIGTVVKVTGHPSRAPGSHGMTAARFTKADGTPVRGQ